MADDIAHSVQFPPGRFCPFFPSLQYFLGRLQPSGVILIGGLPGRGQGLRLITLNVLNGLGGRSAGLALKAGMGQTPDGTGVPFRIIFDCECSID
jgi:hypothetical protein